MFGRRRVALSLFAKLPTLSLRARWNCIHAVLVRWCVIDTFRRSCAELL